MGLLGSAASAYALHRMAGGSRRQGGSRRRRGYGSPYGRRSRSQSGFGFFGPFPSYSRRTRGGSRVKVTGCCLPIPLVMTIGAAAVTKAAVRRI